jgi:hypothetical protein
MDDPQNNPVNQRVERDVRILIGDLHIQILMLRAMVENQQQPQATNGFDREMPNAPSQRTAT